MPAKRNIIAISTLPTHPGYWLLTGRNEGEQGEWRVVRAPNGAYWAVVLPFVGGLSLELGEKISDRDAIAEFEAGFRNLKASAA